MTWVEKCDQLRSELRMAEASSASLGTRLENEQLRSKSLAEDKTRLLSQNKELSEKVAHLHRATASMARSKLLMNQYELKIGALENERGHLQKALAHLESQLNKAQPSNPNLEQQAKQAVLLRHHNKHLKHTENMLR
jgi:chromosome segregation ATPase